MSENSAPHVGFSKTRTSPHKDEDLEGDKRLATPAQWEAMIAAQKKQAAAEREGKDTKPHRRRSATFIVACCEYVEALLKLATLNRANRHSLGSVEVREGIKKEHVKLSLAVVEILTSGPYSRFHESGLRDLEEKVLSAAYGLCYPQNYLEGYDREEFISSVITFMTHALVGIDVVTY